MLSGGGFVTSQVTEVLNAGHIHVAGSHFHTVFIVEHQHVIRAPGRIVGHNRHSRIGDIGHGNRIIFGYELRIVGCIYFHLPLDERSRFPFKNTVSYIILPSCTDMSPNISVVCEENNIGNCILKWYNYFAIIRQR